MLGDGKLCRYELQHPMSLGDALAALFRRKSRKKLTGNSETLLGLGPKPEDCGCEVAAALEREECEEALQVK